MANPSIEALDDVKVQVHTYDAEMGRTGEQRGLQRRLDAGHLDHVPDSGLTQVMFRFSF